MAKPDNVTRFFYYLSLLRQGLYLHHGLLAEGVVVDGRELAPIRKRQFHDDMAYLRELLPLWEPGTTLESLGDGRYGLARLAGSVKLKESEFLPFLKALVTTTNLFPYSVEGWLAQLSMNFDNPSLKVLDHRILYTSTPHPDRLKGDHFHVLVQSLITQYRLDMTVLNREGVERKVDFEPLAFLNHNGVWYLMGDGLFSHRKHPLDQPTQLKLSRLRTCRLSDRPFQNRFDLTETTSRLKSTFGNHLILTNGQGPQSVTLRFHGDAVRHVEESWFHQGQLITRNTDGSCDLTLRVNDLFDALQLAGQWGVLCRPIDPPELVQKWLAKAQDLSAWAETSDH